MNCMRDDPGFDAETIAVCLDGQYGLQIVEIVFLPIGHDMNAFVYRVVADDGSAYFLKIRTGPVYLPALLVPRALIDRGINTVLAPLRTRTSELWASLEGHDGFSVVLYPFIPGENAMVAGLTDDQWRAFGSSLGAIHSSGLEARFHDALRVEDFALPSEALVRQLLRLVDHADFENTAAIQFARFWKDQSERIQRMLDRAEELGAALHPRAFDLVLCHSDIHAANILVGDDERIWLVDWDAPLIAPKERDLLFVIGSRIARTVTPREEDLFFEGYGPVEINPEALIYYRYERIIEDLGEFGRHVFLTRDANEESREHEAELGRGFFEPGGDIDRAEIVSRSCWPNPAESQTSSSARNGDH
jgi:spectinomycin phosphotransferase